MGTHPKSRIRILSLLLVFLGLLLTSSLLPLPLRSVFAPVPLLSNNYFSSLSFSILSLTLPSPSSTRWTILRVFQSRQDNLPSHIPIKKYDLREIPFPSQKDGTTFLGVDPGRRNPNFELWVQSPGETQRDRVLY